VVKEQRATFSAAPETEGLRPGTACGIPNVYLAGDWTRSGWPATMEGAVRSGYLAAEAIAKVSGKSTVYLVS
jgi:zeta-carotene desaturase